MDKKIFAERMKELSTGCENRSAHARIEDDFEDIEVAINKKVNRKAIWAAWNELQPDDLQVPQKTFESAVYRILKVRAGQVSLPKSVRIASELKTNNAKGEDSQKTKPQPVAPSTRSVAPAAEAAPTSNPCHALSTGTGVGVREVKFETEKEERK